MDLNEAMLSAQAGLHVRDDANMRPDWTMRWVAEEKLFYYFAPNGEKKHVIRFNDAHRSSYQWKAVS